MERVVLDLELAQRSTAAPPGTPELKALADRGQVATPKLKGRRKSRSRTPPKVRPDRRAQKDQGGRETKGGRDQPALKPGSDKPKICFAHDPRNSQVCSKGSKCPNDHLYTSQADQASRFDRAFAAFKGKKRDE